MPIIDLSQTLHNFTPVYPGDIPLTLTGYRDIEEDGYYASEISGGFHVGTHIDAPMHMLDDERTIDLFHVAQFYGHGVLLTVTGEHIITYKPDYDVLVQEGDIVLLHTGMDVYFESDPDFYYANHPVLSDELVDFFITKKIKMLGMDMASPDAAPFYAHNALLKNDIFIMENLCNLSTLANIKNFKIIAFPLKVKAEGSYVRAVAITE